MMMTDEETLYRFVVGEEIAVFVPFYKPDENRTRLLTAEPSVSPSTIINMYAKCKLSKGCICKTRDS